MARRQDGKLHAPACEKGTDTNEKCVGPLVHKRCEGRIDLTASAGVEDLDLQPYGASSRFHISQCGLGSGNGGIEEHGNASYSRHQLAQQFESLCRQLLIV